jgi:hypothetical protein
MGGPADPLRLRTPPVDQGNPKATSHRLLPHNHEIQDDRADDAALRQRMKASKKGNDGVVRKDDQWRVTIEAPSSGGKTCVRGVMYQSKKRSPIPCVSKTVVSGTLTRI